MIDVRLSSLAATIHDHALRAPDAPALSADDRATTTYAALDAHLNRVACELRSWLPPQNRIVAIALRNGPDLLTALVAALDAGTCAPLDASRPAREIDGFLADIGPALVVADDESIARHRSSFERFGVAIARCTPQPAAGIFMLELAVDGTGAGPGALLDATTGAVLLVRTSGTTSSSKIVPHTMHGLLHAMTAIAQTLELTPADRCLNARPLHHLHAIAHVIGASFVAGGSIVCIRDITAPAVIDALTRERPTWYSAAPPVHRDIVAAADAATKPIVHTLRFARSSSASLPADVSAGIERVLGVPMLQGYGMSEAPSIALNPLPPHARKPGSVGRPTGCAVRIAGDDGNAVDADRIGELQIRGEHVAAAYATRGDPLPIVDPRDGWFRTGDSGRIDGDGYLFLTGRLNELINVGGEKVAPADVEAVLRAHPAIADAVAIALPHETLGEHVAAAVVLAEGATVAPSEIVAYASERLRRHAMPGVVHVVASIARDANGKVRRRDVAEIVLRERADARRARALAGNHLRDDALRHALARAWETVLGRTPDDVDENFFAAGGDSLRAVRLLERIEATLGVALPTHALLVAPTIDELAALVLAQSQREQTSRLIALRSTGSRSPLVFFDGDLNGGGLYARFLVSVLDDDQPVYVVRPHGSNGEPIPDCIEAIADADAALIAAAVPARAYRLGGYCNGGVVALEVARRLQRAGATVDVIALVGASAPNVRLEPLWQLVSLAARCAPGIDRLRWFRAGRRIVNAARAGRYAASMRHALRGVRGGARAEAPAAASTEMGIVGYKTPTYRAYEDRLTRYFPRPLDGVVDVIWADDDEPRLPGDPTMGWGRVARTRRHAVRGDHTTMLTDHIDELGRALQSIVADADAGRAR